MLLLPVLIAIAMIVVHVLLALGVKGEVSRMRRAQVPLYAMHGDWWLVVVLITGLPGFALFWAIHSSALRDHGLFRR